MNRPRHRSRSRFHRRSVLDRSRFALLLCGALLAAVLAGCRPPQEGSAAAGSAGGDAPATGRSVQVEVVDEASLGPAQLRVTVLQDGEPVEGARVEITGDMTHAGMAPVIAGATGVDGETGIYLSEGFEFTMAGDWILSVEATYPDGDTVQEELFVNVAAP